MGYTSSKQAIRPAADHLQRVLPWLRTLEAQPLLKTKVQDVMLRKAVEQHLRRLS